jgi:hypothetical protein
VMILMAYFTILGRRNCHFHECDDVFLGSCLSENVTNLYWKVNLPTFLECMFNLISRTRKLTVESPSESLVEQFS